MRSGSLGPRGAPHAGLAGNLIHNRLVVVLSDLHLADPASGPGDDFDRDEDFERLLAQVIPAEVGWPVTLVLAGDFIDFTRVLPDLALPWSLGRFGTRQEDSLRKLLKVIAAHPKVFSAIGRLLRNGGQVLVLPGNHDVDFHWPAVFGAFRRALGGPESEQLRFVAAGAIQEQGIRIEHGHQHTFDNRFDHWGDPILESLDGPRLERPWGSLFMELIYNDLEELRPFIYTVLSRSGLARALLGGLLDRDGTSRRSLARLVPFFLATGPRLVGRRFRARQKGWLGRVAECSRRTVRFPRSRPAETPARLPGPAGDTAVVVLGHTHLPIDGDRRSPGGGAGLRPRTFNPGSWLPRIPFPPDRPMRFRDLKRISPVHDLRYLVIDLARPVRPRLRRL